MTRHATTCVERASDRPFDSIESSREYVGLLEQAIQEAADEVVADLQEAPPDGEEWRREAFQVVAHKLESLRLHVVKSRRLLSDLRNLRVMLDCGLPLVPASRQALRVS